MDTLATALLSIKTSGQRQSVYDSDFIKMRLWRQRPKNLGNKTFSGHEEEGNVTFPSADVIFGSDEKIQKPGTVDTQVSYHHLPINPRLRDPSVKKKRRRNHPKTRSWDPSKTLPRSRDQPKIVRDHVFRGNILYPCQASFAIRAGLLVFCYSLWKAYWQATFIDPTV